MTIEEIIKKWHHMSDPNYPWTDPYEAEHFILETYSVVMNELLTIAIENKRLKYDIKLLTALKEE